MTEKHDVIFSVLKERITQLEAELENSNDRLLATLEEKDELVKEMEDLRSEAHEVICQWEKEASDLRNKLESHKSNISYYDSLIKEKDDAKKEMEKKTQALEDLSSTHSLSIVTLQEQLNEAKQSEKSLHNELMKTRSEWTELTERVKEYKKLAEDMENEIKNLRDSKMTLSQDQQKLHTLFSDAMKENGFLKVNNNQLTLQAQSLMNHNVEQKNNSERIFKEYEMTQQRYIALQTELRNAKSLLDERENCLLKLNSENAALELLNEDLTNRVNEILMRAESSEAVSQQQLEIISGYEKDMDELKDACIARCNIIEELRSKTARLEEELTSTTSSRKDLDTQLMTIKDRYSSLLMDSNKANLRNEGTISELKSEVDLVKKESSQLIILTENKFEAALRSVEELIASLHTFQVREFFILEQEQRCRLELSFQAQFQLLKDEFARVSLSELRDLKKESEKTRFDLLHACTEKKQAVNTIYTLKEQLSAADNSLYEKHKTCTSLEQELSNSNSAMKVLQTKNNALEEDNSWLKNQVEAMRRELGELDELLNTSLNEMREDNERLQIENQLVQESLKKLREERARAEEKTSHTSKELNVLKEELAAQTRTLNLTEGQLRCSNTQLERVGGILNETKSRLEFQEKTRNDLLSSNTVLLSKVNSLNDQLLATEASKTSVVNEKQNEIIRLKTKTNELIQRCQDYESNLAEERKKHLETSESFNILKESVGKMKNRFDELKERCGSDADSIKQLLGERDDLLKEKDTIVEKYNKLHEAFVKVRKESMLKTSTELERLIELASTQEKELHLLRNENIILKKSVSMFMKASSKSETILIEKLNLSEGPLRHPKKIFVSKDSK
ncbi:unnamed protein product [Phytomonas sp. Hart1]|nr:unnamed protein product [Phytomonas sp. Hart1]|eukprot:CCW68801.1 unnamed protein product [Phytomonas sp. isolate Hart1]